MSTFVKKYLQFIDDLRFDSRGGVSALWWNQNHHKNKSEFELDVEIQPEPVKSTQTEADGTATHTYKMPDGK